MPIVNGKHYASAAYGESLERSRIADAFPGLAQEAKSKPDSWASRLIDHVTASRSVSEPPPSPKPPGMPPQAYDDMKINAMKVRQVANVVANENHDVKPGKSSAEQLQEARIAQAHAVINADQMYGKTRPQIVRTASDEVTPTLENSPQYHQALDAARTAFQEQLAGYDPIGGRMWFNNRPDAGTYPRHMRDENLPVFKQFGPFQLGDRTRYTLIDNNPMHMPKPRLK